MLGNHPDFEGKSNTNKLRRISLSFVNQFKLLEELTLAGNPIKNIPTEVFNKGDFFAENVLEPVRNYLQDLQKGRLLNKTLKLIFIGNGSVGKTQIAKRLVEQNQFVFNEQHDSTHAIVLMKRTLGEVELQLWDFAGQDLYHATHRLFMQTRALFVLVWDFENEQQDFHEWEGKKYKNEKRLYWLEYAKCFGQDSPILVLQNKVDSETDAEHKDLEETYDHFKNQYPILDFLQVSAKTGKGFKLLERVLKKRFRTHPTLRQHLQQELPTTWVKVRERIELLQKSGKKTMEVADFKVLCSEAGIPQSSSTLLNYLHDTGVLYYRSGYFDNRILLNQDWAIKAIYKVLHRTSDYAEVLLHQKGHLDYENLCEIWKDNSDTERTLFVDFMLSTELCFETTIGKKKWELKPLEERTFVLPQFLPADKPNEVLFWEKERQIRQLEEVIPYDFLPKVFVERFIVKAHRFSHVQLMWQKGLLLQTEEGFAVVEADYSHSQQIVIYATHQVLIDKILEELVERVKSKPKSRVMHLLF